MQSSALDLETIIRDFSEALFRVDSRCPVCKEFMPGIGPFGEKQGVQMAFDEMRIMRPGAYDNAEPRKLGGCSSPTDIVIDEDWALEIKVARPYGNNGELEGHWIQNVLYPYRGNYSMLGDGMKLRDAEFPGRKAIIVYGFEHPEPQTELETAIRAFELVASKVIGLQLSDRIERRSSGLVHPVHANMIVAGWEVMR